LPHLAIVLMHAYLYVSACGSLVTAAQAVWCHCKMYAMHIDCGAPLVQVDPALRRVYLSNVCVATATRRQGVAAALMRAAEDLARGLGELRVCCCLCCCVLWVGWDTVKSFDSISIMWLLCLYHSLAVPAAAFHMPST
jgi:GNAT superfamily N-acetyltransferase